MTNSPILIIGAGPTGLLLALELSLHHIPYRIIEASETRSPYSRALALQSRTLELLSRHSGVINACLALGCPNTAVRLFVNKSFVFELDAQDIAMPDTTFKTPLMISQADTEKVLENAIGKYGVSVERGVRAEMVKQDDNEARAWLKHSTGQIEEVRCRYIVGCDGAHSVVRKSANLAFEGSSYPQDFILADLHINWEQKNCITTFMGRGVMAIFPLPGNMSRIICSRPYESGTNAQPTIRDFEDISKEMVPGPVELSQPVWMTRFRLHRRMVVEYSKGRLFLAGDAAHIHSPAGGQGLNTGMQDSVNLAWKLASVIRGEEREDFLDTYSIERHRVGANLLRGTDRLFEFAASTNPIFLWVRNLLVPWIVPWVMRTRSVRASRFRFISQLGVRYRHSPVVGQAKGWKGRLKGGDRVPDAKIWGTGGKETTFHDLISEPCYHLIVFLAESERETCEVLKGIEFGKGSVSHVKILRNSEPSQGFWNDQDGILHDLCAIQGPTYLLIRPDGHISFVGPLSALDELRTWINK